MKNRYKEGKDGQLVTKAGDPVTGPISTQVENQPPLAYDKDKLKPGAGTKMQRWIAAYNKALAEDCRQSENPTECARAYANKAVGRVETDVEPVEKTKTNGRVIKRIAEFIRRGGPGSGHHGHKGREGEVGGSQPGSGGFSSPRKIYHGDKGERPPSSKPAEGEIGDTGIGYAESMPKAHTMKDKDWKKWVRGLSMILTPEEIQKRLDRYNERIAEYTMPPWSPGNEALQEYEALHQLYTEIQDNQKSVSFPSVGSEGLPSDTGSGFTGSPREEEYQRATDQFREAAEEHTRIYEAYGVAKPGDRFTTFEGEWEYTRSNYNGVPYFTKVKGKRVGKTEYTVEQLTEEFMKKKRDAPIEEPPVKKEDYAFRLESFLKVRGGPGSGHHGHKGREGEIGGSLPSGAAGAAGGGRVKFTIPKERAGGTLWEREIISISPRENPGYYDVVTDDALAGQPDYGTRYFSEEHLDKYAPGWRDMLGAEPIPGDAYKPEPYAAPPPPGEQSAASQDLSRVAEQAAAPGGAFSDYGMENMTQRRRELEGMGIRLSQWTNWSGEELMVIGYAALEDANWHSEAAPLYEASKYVAADDSWGAGDSDKTSVFSMIAKEAAAPGGVFNETGIANMTQRRRELEGLGVRLSEWSGYDGDQLQVIFYAALEDSNWHQEAAPLFEATKHVAAKSEAGIPIMKSVGGASDPFYVIEKGGAGSGHHGHEGRPGEKGGSKPGKGSGRKPKKGFSTPGSGTGHYERGPDYIGPDKPAKTGKESSALAKAAGLKPGEKMRRVTELKGKERKKWVRATAMTNTLEQLRGKQERTNERIGRFHYDKNEEELEYENAYADFLTEVVMYQNFPETREDAHTIHEGPPMTIMESIARGHYGRVAGSTYPMITIKGGPGSGHHGHRGRVGEVGGSEPGTGVSSRKEHAYSEPREYTDEDAQKLVDAHRKKQDALMDKVIALQDRLETEELSDAEVDKLQDELLAVNDELLDTGDFEYQRVDPLGEGMKETHQKEMEGETFQTGDYVVSATEKKLDGMRRHKFLTKAIEKKLPALYSQENNPDPTVYGKWFHPYSNMTWYATEYDPKVGMFFGYVDTGDFNSELGYFSRAEMAETLVKGLPIERDKYFNPVKLSEIMNKPEVKSMLRGEDNAMDEHPLATKMREEVMEGYVKRKDVRARLNDVDYALIERMGDQEIIRPDRFSTITWRTMPPSQKNVRAEATRRIIERNYAQAVEDAQVNGWKAKINHYQPDEYYFVKPHDTEDAGRVIMRAVLVREEDSVEWTLRTLSQFAAESIAVQLPKGILRHNKEQLLKIPVIRGGPGSGHRGHKGRPGEVGGSLPSGDSGSAGRKTTEPKEQFKPSINVDEMSDEELHDLYAEIGMLEDAPDHIQHARKQADEDSEESLAERLPEMSISEIASAARKDWNKKGKGVNYAAKPYLEAMGSLSSINDNYMFDSGSSVVMYFLSNAGTWRGPVAKMVKAELNKRLKAGR